MSVNRKRSTNKAASNKAIAQAKTLAESEAKSSAPKPVVKPIPKTSKNPAGTRAARAKVSRVEALRDQGLDVPESKTTEFTLTPKPVKDNKNAPKYKAKTQAVINEEVQRLRSTREARRAEGLGATKEAVANAEARKDISDLHVAATRVQRRQVTALARLRRLAPNNPLVTEQTPEDLNVIKARLAKMPKSEVVTPKTSKNPAGSITKKQAIIKATFDERLKAAGKLPATGEGTTNG